MKKLLIITLSLPVLFCLAGIGAGVFESLTNAATDHNVQVAFKAKFERMAGN